VIWSRLVKLLDSVADWDTIWVCESVRLKMEQMSERGSLQKFLLVGFTDCSPLVTLQQGALTWIDHVSLITKPISWESMHSIQIAVMVLRMNSSFVSLLQIMADMKELGLSEVVAEVTVLDVACHQPCEPIIGDANRGLDLLLAAVLEASFVEDGQLEDNVASPVALVRCREDLSIVQEDDSHASFPTLVDCNLHLLVLHLNSEVAHKSYTSWVVSKVPRLPFAVSLVVRRDDCDLLAEFDETYCKLIDHHSESTDCRPSPELGRREYNISQFIALEH
jgi:hypothetical protein